MQRYIEQLIEDIGEIVSNCSSANKFKEESVHDDESFFRHIDDVENYIHGEGEAISTITGIDYNMLPPSERLTNEHKALLANELENLLHYFHFSLDFPANYPVHLRYPFIRNFWNEKHAAMSVGTSHIEFCDYDKENCPFPNYCKTCDEFDAQIEDDEENTKQSKSDEIDEDQLPF